MKKLLVLLAAIAFSATAHATVYKFSYSGTYGSNGSDNVVTGSFEGSANGNVINNLSNISVSINGTAFNGSGNLFGSSYSNNLGWVSGGAQASFDGTQNNFLFINVDYPNSYGYTNYFYSVNGGASNYAYNASAGTYQYASGNAATASTWSVTQTDVPEPASMALFGLGLAALAFKRNKKNA